MDVRQLQEPSIALVPVCSLLTMRYMSQYEGSIVRILTMLTHIQHESAEDTYRVAVEWYTSISELCMSLACR